MSIDIGIQHLAGDGSQVPARPGVLQALLTAARRVFAEANMPDETIVAPDGDSFSVVLPSGTATVYANYGVFPGFADIDPLTRRMIFELAKAGDMYILGDSLTVRTNPAQPVPRWVRAEQAAPLCQSPEQLAIALEKWLGPYRGFRDSALPELAGQSQAQRTVINLQGKTWIADVLEEERTWAPGSRLEGPASFVYVEARPRETATKQQKKLYKHHRDACKARRRRSEDAGLLTAEFWRLTTPADQTFYAYGFGGDNETWQSMFRGFAAAEGRALGRIENFDTFVQDDGRNFPLSACTCKKVKE